MILNGEAWKDRGNTTYSSLLDMYGVPDLFSGESMDLYAVSKQEQITVQQEMKEYLFSSQIQGQNREENVMNQIFSEPLQLSRTQSYSRTTSDYSVSLVMAEILFVLVFIYILMKWNARRRESREKHAAEIDL